MYFLTLLTLLNFFICYILYLDIEYNILSKPYYVVFFALMMGYVLYFDKLTLENILTPKIYKNQADNELHNSFNIKYIFICEFLPILLFLMSCGILAFAIVSIICLIFFLLFILCVSHVLLI